MNDLGDAGLLTLSDAAVAKAGNVMAVTRSDGSAAAGVQHPLGVYRDDSRFVSAWELRLDGVAPVLLASTEDGPAATTFELTNPPLGPDLPLETLRLRLRRTLDGAGSMRDVLTVRSHARTRVAAELTLDVAADFLPMVEVRGFVEPDRPAVTPDVTASADGVRFAATGRDGVVRSTTLTAAPVPATCGDAGRLTWPLDLEPGETVELTLDVAFGMSPEPAAGRAPLPSEPPVLTLGDGLHQRALDRAMADLEILRSELDGHAYFAAGIPWFACLFGRDSLITATAALAFHPEVAADTLRLLAAHLGTETDPFREEEPGKVLHELRGGEVLAADLSPIGRYYGSIDATALWLGLLADHADWTGDLGLFRELRPQVDAMIGWLDAQGELLTYEQTRPGGLRNQGWKDSTDGVARADGTWLEPPIALCEAQGYAIRARRDVARLLRAADEDGSALDAAADVHAARLADRFRLPDGRGFSMALDGDGRPSDAQASDQGHLLWSGALGDADAAAVRDAVLAPELFSGWGVRTFGTAGAGYSPYGYHLGTVWPHDTAVVAAGLRRYGFDDAFDRVAFGLLEAATLAPRMRLPELFAGFDRAECAVPVPHPVACQPQAWSAAAVPWLLTLALGLRPDGLDGRLEITRPRLPPGVERATLTGLKIAGATVDLRFERGADGTVALAVADVRDGELEVLSLG